jgi:chromosome segregation ATPase
MGRIGVSYEEVAQAVQEAQGKGNSPTVDNVRLIIGSGSKSTIARHLREWRNQQGIARGSDGAIPSELLDLVKGLWERLRDTVEQKAYDYQCEADDKVKQIQNQLIQYQQQYTSLQEQHHKLEEKLHQQTKMANELQSTFFIEQQEKVKITERYASQESHRQEQQNEITRLHQLLKHLQKNLEHYQTTTQDLHQEQSLSMDKQRYEYEQRITQLQQQIADVTTEKSTYQAQHEHSQQTLEKLQSIHTALNQTANEAQTQCYSLAQENGRLNKQSQVQFCDLEVKNQLVIELLVRLETSEEKVISLEKILTIAEDKIQILRDEKLFLSNEKSLLEGMLNVFTKNKAEAINQCV